MSTSSTALAPDEPPAEPSDAPRRHVRGSALLLLGRFVSLGINLAAQVLTVRYLSMQGYGALAFGLWMASLGASLTVFGLDKTLARFVPMYEEQREYGKLIGAVLLTVLSVTSLGLALGLAVFAGQSLIARTVTSDDLSLTLLLMLIALAPIQALDSVLMALFAALVGARSIFFRRHVLGPGLQLLAVVLVIVLGGDVRHMAIGYLVSGLLGSAIFGVMLFGVLRRRGLLQGARASGIRWPWKEIGGFGVPMFLSDLAFLVRGAFIGLFLEGLVGSKGVAEFRAVLPVARLNEVVLRSFTFLFIPITARLLAQGRQAEIGGVYWKSVVWITVFSFPAFCVSFALCEPTTLLLFGERYADAAPVLACLALGYFVHSAVGLNARTLKVCGHIRIVMAIDLTLTALSVAANWLCIVHWGVLGGAISVAVSLVLHSAINQVALRHATGIAVFDWRYAKLYASVAAATGLLWLYQRFLGPPIYVGLSLAAVLSLGLIYQNRHALAGG